MTERAARSSTSTPPARTKPRSRRVAAEIGDRLSRRRLLLRRRTTASPRALMRRGLRAVAALLRPAARREAGHRDRDGRRQPRLFRPPARGARSDARPRPEGGLQRRPRSCARRSGTPRRQAVPRAQRLAGTAAASARRCSPISTPARRSAGAHPSRLRPRPRPAARLLSTTSSTGRWRRCGCCTIRRRDGRRGRSARATHTDYGNLTLLATDDVGGLEVRTRDGRLDRGAAAAGRLRRQHRRLPDALDQRRLRLDAAPRRQPLAAASAIRSPSSSTRTRTREVAAIPPASARRAALRADPGGGLSEVPARREREEIGVLPKR